MRLFIYCDGDRVLVVRARGPHEAASLVQEDTSCVTTANDVIELTDTRGAPEGSGIVYKWEPS